jgi:hypothetical protein
MLLLRPRRHVTTARAHPPATMTPPLRSSTRVVNKFEWAPDEIIIMIFMMLGSDVLWSGVLEKVCTRWWRLMKSTHVQNAMHVARWAAYARRRLKPTAIKLPRSVETLGIVVAVDGDVWVASTHPIVYRVVHSKKKIRVTPFATRGRVEGIVKQNNTVYVWDITGCVYDYNVVTKHYSMLHEFEENITCIAVNSNGTIFCGTTTGSIIEQRKCGHREVLNGVAPARHTQTVRSLEITHDNKLLSSAWPEDRKVLRWEFKGERNVESFVHDGVPKCVIPKENRVITGCGDNVWVWDSPEKRTIMIGHTESVLALAERGSLLFSSSMDHTLRVWCLSRCVALHVIDNTYACELAISNAKQWVLYTNPFYHGTQASSLAFY